MPNKRIFFAIKQVAVKKDGEPAGSYRAIHGLQSFGMNTTFNLENVFEIGQISIYENIENVPDIECTLEKVLDGYPLIYHLLSIGATSATLAGRSTVSSDIGFSTYDDTKDSASGTPIAECQISGIYASRLTYTFPTEGNCTESVTAIGNNKVWRSTGFTMVGLFNNTDVPLALTSGVGGVQRRENVIFLPPDNPSNDVNGMVATNRACVLPPDVDGITASGLNLKTAGQYGAHISQITVTTDFNRTDLLELGRRAPYFKYVNFPIEVTCDIEVIPTRGDFVQATEDGVYGSGINLLNRTIKIRTEDGTFLNLGTKNKLASVSQGGGDAGGGNETVTYSFSNFNDLEVKHPADPTASLANSYTS